MINLGPVVRMPGSSWLSGHQAELWRSADTLRQRAPLAVRDRIDHEFDRLFEKNNFTNPHSLELFLKAAVRNETKYAFPSQQPGDPT